MTRRKGGVMNNKYMKRAAAAAAVLAVTAMIMTVTNDNNAYGSADEVSVYWNEEADDEPSGLTGETVKSEEPVNNTEINNEVITQDQDVEAVKVPDDQNISKEEDQIKDKEDDQIKETDIQDISDQDDEKATDADGQAQVPEITPAFFLTVNGLYYDLNDPASDYTGAEEDMIHAQEGEEIAFSIRNADSPDILYVLVNGGIGDYSFDGEKCVIDDSCLIKGKNIISVKIIDAKGKVFTSGAAEIMYDRNDIVI